MPIRAVIFDLDGTLVRTEDLKAQSYAVAVHELNPRISEGEVIGAFQDVVGMSREQVSRTLAERFFLRENGVEVSWEQLADRRLEVYESFLGNRALLREFECPYNVELLKHVRRKRLKSGLATMSHAREAYRVLALLGITDDFDTIVTREQVIHAKPHPEIYRHVADALRVDPMECLVIEDSPSGITSAQAAGMHCLAVTTNLTRKRVHQEAALDPWFIVDDPRILVARAEEILRRLSELEQTNNENIY
jgi:HAD superfamily hydrolase (TIGR01509 family)